MGIKPSSFTPANTSDYMQNHSERNVLSHSEYLRLKDTEMEKEEWKLEFDIDEAKVADAVANARANPSDP